MDYSAATRETRVVSVNIVHTNEGDPLHPMPSEFNGSHDEVWVVWVELQAGFLPITTTGFIFETAENAENFQAEHPVGSVWNDDIEPIENESEIADLVRKKIDEHDSRSPFFGGADALSSLPLEVLSGSQVWEGTNPSKLVVETLGKARIDALKDRFGDNWCVAAEFEYCHLNLPHSSAAYIAALQRFNYFILDDDFSAGYLLRDLEIVCAEVESQAKQTLDMRKNAGVRGSESSARARKERIVDLIDHMEQLAARNPDICKLGIDSLASLAGSQAIEENQKLWSQGKGQIEEYAHEVHRGDAGERLQRRLFALLQGKTA